MLTQIPDGYVFIAKEAGIHYAYQIIQRGQDYYCEGYALCNGVKLTDWRYIALSLNEAHEQMTKDYLLREMRPMAVHTLKHLATSYENWLNYVRIENANAIREAVEAAL